ncbi:oligosaccharide flippase family protein [Psychromonas sp.]|uniref:oligosaccharide flippase family protein n=1 Tax=Psychromonas sp. TaxID=1884585 RepID=UPI0035650C65
MKVNILNNKLLENLAASYQQHFARLIKNALWLLSSEVLGKGSRLLTIIVLAAILTPSQYGSGMLALACHDILRLLLRSGAGNQVINCSEEQLPVIAKNAMSLQWLMCILLIILQLLLAQVASLYFANPDVAQLLTVMAVSYALFPLVSVRVFLLQRNNNMAFVGLCSGLCLLIENLSIAALVFISEDVMAIAYGKIIFSIAWLIIFSFAPSKDFAIGFDWEVIKKLLSSSSKMIFAESGKALQQHLDLFFAAKLLSPESFGLYSFAKSAGIGLSQSLNSAFNNALYPQLCKFNRDGHFEHRVRNIYWLTLLVSSAFVAQAGAAFFYIPLLFADSWTAAIPVSSILCLSACATLFVDVKCNMLRAQRCYSCENFIRLFTLAICMTGLLIYQPESPIALASAMLILAGISLAIFLPINRFHHNKPALKNA